MEPSPFSSSSLFAGRPLSLPGTSSSLFGRNAPSASSVFSAGTYAATKPSSSTPFSSSGSSLFSASASSSDASTFFPSSGTPGPSSSSLFSSSMFSTPSRSSSSSSPSAFSSSALCPASSASSLSPDASSSFSLARQAVPAVVHHAAADRNASPVPSFCMSSSSSHSSLAASSSKKEPFVAAGGRERLCTPEGDFIPPPLPTGDARCLLAGETGEANPLLAEPEHQAPILLKIQDPMQLLLQDGASASDGDGSAASADKGTLNSFFVGKLYGYCSEEEMLDKQQVCTTSDFERLEAIVPGDPEARIINPYLAVASFRRSDAGKPFHPISTRPAVWCRRTVHHLLTYSVDADLTNPVPGSTPSECSLSVAPKPYLYSRQGRGYAFLDVYNFLRDRLRACWQHLTVQHVQKHRASIETLEISYRFLIFAEEQLASHPGFDRVSNQGLMQTCLDKLMHGYEAVRSFQARRDFHVYLHRCREAAASHTAAAGELALADILVYKSRYEGEFWGYRILSLMSSSGSERALVGILQRLPPDLLSHDCVRFALAAFAAFRSANVRRYVQLMRTGKFLCGVLMNKFANFARARALRNLVSNRLVHDEKHPITLERIRRLLGFDGEPDESFFSFLSFFSLRVETGHPRGEVYCYCGELKKSLLQDLSNYRKVRAPSFPSAFLKPPPGLSRQQLLDPDYAQVAARAPARLSSSFSLPSSSSSRPLPCLQELPTRAAPASLSVHASRLSPASPSLAVSSSHLLPSSLTSSGKGPATDPRESPPTASTSFATDFSQPPAEALESQPPVPSSLFSSPPSAVAPLPSASSAPSSVSPSTVSGASASEPRRQSEQERGCIQVGEEDLPGASNPSQSLTPSRSSVQRSERAPRVSSPSASPAVPAPLASSAPCEESPLGRAELGSGKRTSRLLNGASRPPAGVRISPPASPLPLTPSLLSPLPQKQARAAEEETEKAEKAQKSPESGVAGVGASPARRPEASVSLSAEATEECRDVCPLASPLAFFSSMSEAKAQADSQTERGPSREASGTGREGGCNEMVSGAERLSKEWGREREGKVEAARPRRTQKEETLRRDHDVLSEAKKCQEREEEERRREAEERRKREEEQRRQEQRQKEEDVKRLSGEDGDWWLNLVGLNSWRDGSQRVDALRSVLTPLPAVDTPQGAERRGRRSRASLSGSTVAIGKGARSRSSEGKLASSPVSRGTQGTEGEDEPARDEVELEELERVLFFPQLDCSMKQQTPGGARTLGTTRRRRGRSRQSLFCRGPSYVPSSASLSSFPPSRRRPDLSRSRQKPSSSGALSPVSRQRQTSRAGSEEGSPRRKGRCESLPILSQPSTPLSALVAAVVHRRSRRLWPSPCVARVLQRRGRRAAGTSSSPAVAGALQQTQGEDRRGDAYEGGELEGDDREADDLGVYVKFLFFTSAWLLLSRQQLPRDPIFQHLSNATDSNRLLLPELRMEKGRAGGCGVWGGNKEGIAEELQFSGSRAECPDTLTSSMMALALSLTPSCEIQEEAENASAPSSRDGPLSLPGCVALGLSSLAGSQESSAFASDAQPTSREEADAEKELVVLPSTIYLWPASQQKVQRDPNVASSPFTSAVSPPVYTCLHVVRSQGSTSFGTPAAFASEARQQRRASGPHTSLAGANQSQLQAQETFFLSEKNALAGTTGVFLTLPFSVAVAGPVSVACAFQRRERDIQASPFSFVAFSSVARDQESAKTTETRRTGARAEREECGSPWSSSGSCLPVFWEDLEPLRQGLGERREDGKAVDAGKEADRRMEVLKEILIRLVSFVSRFTDGHSLSPSGVSPSLSRSGASQEDACEGSCAELPMLPVRILFTLVVPLHVVRPTLREWREGDLAESLEPPLQHAETHGETLVSAAVEEEAQGIVAVALRRRLAAIAADCDGWTNAEIRNRAVALLASPLLQFTCAGYVPLSRAFLSSASPCPSVRAASPPVLPAFRWVHRAVRSMTRRSLESRSLRLLPRPVAVPLADMLLAHWSLLLRRVLSSSPPTGQRGPEATKDAETEDEETQGAASLSTEFRHDEERKREEYRGKDGDALFVKNLRAASSLQASLRHVNTTMKSVENIIRFQTAACQWQLPPAEWWIVNEKSRSSCEDEKSYEQTHAVSRVGNRRDRGKEGNEVLYPGEGVRALVPRWESQSFLKRRRQAEGRVRDPVTGRPILDREKDLLLQQGMRSCSLCGHGDEVSNQSERKAGRGDAVALYRSDLGLDDYLQENYSRDKTLQILHEFRRKVQEESKRIKRLLSDTGKVMNESSTDLQDEDFVTWGKRAKSGRTVREICDSLQLQAAALFDFLEGKPRGPTAQRRGLASVTCLLVPRQVARLLLPAVAEPWADLEDASTAVDPDAWLPIVGPEIDEEFGKEDRRDMRRIEAFNSSCRESDASALRDNERTAVATGPRRHETDAMDAPSTGRQGGSVFRQSIHQTCGQAQSLQEVTNEKRRDTAGRRRGRDEEGCRQSIAVLASLIESAKRCRLDLEVEKKETDDFISYIVRSTA
uniref:SAC3/GANP family protein n=1 Tax=Toxoplasma gondii COUG TaxID=1074873 RepID=A0A2G8XR99_TOXGO|nr:SAC3/GANP family protein [Toxoplasma gondii COUG]